MRYAVIENGIVANVVAAEADFAAEQGWVGIADGPAIGWSYEGGVFAPPAPEPEVVPAFVTRGQAQIALWRAQPDGALFNAAANAVAAVGGEALLWWNTAETYRRDNQWVAAIGPLLELTSDDIDQLFRDAAKIQ